MQLVKVGKDWINMDQVTLIREMMVHDQDPEPGPVPSIPTLRVWFSGGKSDYTDYQKQKADALRAWLDAHASVANTTGDDGPLVLFES